MEPGSAFGASDASTGLTFQAATEMELLRQQLTAMKMGVAEEARKRMAAEEKQKEAEEKQKEEARLRLEAEEKQKEEARMRLEAEEKQKAEARLRLEAEEKLRKRDEAALLPKFDVSDERLFDYLAEKGLLRDVRDGPTELFVSDLDTPLLNREKTLAKIATTFDAAFVAPIDKQPVAAVTGGPGCGKTRMLHTIMQVVNTGNLAGVAGLDFAPEQGQHVQAVFDKLVGEKALAVGITFNSDTSARTGEEDVNRAVALRLFYACFMRNHVENFDLLRDLVSGHPTPSAVVQLIRKRYGDGRPSNFPIILCADELRKYVQKITGEGIDFGSVKFRELVDRLLSALTSTIRSRVTLLVSSLSASMLNNWTTPGSERSIERAQLLPLRPQDVLALTKETTVRFKDFGFRAKVVQAFDDAQGSPRFVIELIKLFQQHAPVTADPNFQVLVSAKALRTLSTFIDFVKQIYLPEMRQSLVAAVLGDLVNLKDFDSAVSTGILLMREDDLTGSFRPVMPPMLMWFLAQEDVVVAANNGVVANDERLRVDVVAARILMLAKEFTGFDYSLSPGKAFEGQFAYMLQMRALALFVCAAKGSLGDKCLAMPVETFKTSLAELLNVTQPFLHTDAALASLQWVLTLPAILEQVTLPKADFAASTRNRSTTGPLARIVLASDDQNPGWDVALQVRGRRAASATTELEDIIVLFQNRWSKQQAETETGKGDIANDIINTVKHHQYLHASINAGRTLLVHLSYRHVATPNNIYLKAILDAVNTANASKKKLTADELETARKLCETSMVINKADLQRLLGPSFRERPAFRDTAVTP